MTRKMRRRVTRDVARVMADAGRGRRRRGRSLGRGVGGAGLRAGARVGTGAVRGGGRDGRQRAGGSAGHRARGGGGVTDGLFHHLGGVGLVDGLDGVDNEVLQLARVGLRGAARDPVHDVRQPFQRRVICRRHLLLHIRLQGGHEGARRGGVGGVIGCIGRRGGHLHDDLRQRQGFPEKDGRVGQRAHHRAAVRTGGIGGVCDGLLLSVQRHIGKGAVAVGLDDGGRDFHVGQIIDVGGGLETPACGQKTPPPICRGNDFNDVTVRIDKGDDKHPLDIFVRRVLLVEGLLERLLEGGKQHRLFCRGNIRHIQAH